MKINEIKGKNIEDLNLIKEIRKKEETVRSGPTQSNEKIVSHTETVEISSQKLIENAIKKISSMPEIREEKIIKIKAQIQSGTYNVSNKEIAAAMIKSLLSETV